MMSDYTELVKKLRFYQAGTLYYKQAADAIEELSRSVDASIPKSDAEIIISEVAKAQPKWIPVTEEHDGEVSGLCGSKPRWR